MMERSGTRRAHSRKLWLFVTPLLLVLASMGAAVAITSIGAGNAAAAHPAVSVYSYSQSASTLLPPGITGPSTNAIVANSGAADSTDQDVLTCHSTIAVAANSVVIISSTEYSDAVLTFASYPSKTWTQLEEGTVSTTYPLAQIDAAVVTTAISSMYFAVNYTADEYYDCFAVDLLNTVVTSTYTSGTVAASTGDSESGTCSVTPTVAGEYIFAIVGAKSTSTTVTYTLGSGQTKIQNTATTTDIDAGETWYYVDSSSGTAYAMTATLSATEDWETECVGVDPASVPTAPSGLTAGTATGTTVPLTWTDTASQQSYITSEKIWSALYSAGSCGAYATQTNTSLSATGGTASSLTAGQGYCFEVAVDNSTGASAFSSAITDIVTIGVAGAPTGLTVTPQPFTTTVLNLQWTATLANPAAANYTLYERSGATSCTSGGTSHWYNIADPTATYNQTTGLSAGTSYSFEISEYNTQGVGTWSSCVTANTYALPAAATGLSASAETSSSISLAWTQPTAGTGQSPTNDTVFYEATACTGQAIVGISEGVASSTTVTGLNPYTTYCFWIAVWSGGGQGASSSTLQVQTQAAKPGPPSNFVVTSATATTLVLSWTNPQIVGGTEINETVYYGSTCHYVTGNGGTNGWASNVNLNSGALTTYTLSGLSSVTAYCVGLSAWTQAGQGAQVTLNYTTLNAAPSAPTNLLYVTASHTAVTMIWTQGTGAVISDTIAYTTVAACASGLTTVVLGLANTSTIGSLSAATSYYWEVSDSSNGGTSAYSSCVTGATQSATPPAPYNLASQSVTATSTWVLWTNPAGYSLTNNEVYVSAANGVCGTWSQSDLIGIVTEAYQVTGLTASSTYCIEATAIDNQSAYSEPLYVTTASSSGNGGASVTPPLDISLLVGLGVLGLIVVAVVVGITHKPKQRSYHRGR